MEVVSLLIAIIALIYAALAHNSTRRATQLSKASDTVNLRIQAQSALSEIKS